VNVPEAQRHNTFSPGCQNEIPNFNQQTAPLHLTTFQTLPISFC
jgi:hypothetical protein